MKLILKLGESRPGVFNIGEFQLLRVCVNYLQQVFIFLAMGVCNH